MESGGLIGDSEVGDIREAEGAGITESKKGGEPEEGEAAEEVSMMVTGDGGRDEGCRES